MKACLEGLEQWLQLTPKVGQGGAITLRKRLRLGRWANGLRETPYDRAMIQDQLLESSNK